MFLPLRRSRPLEHSMFKLMLMYLLIHLSFLGIYKKTKENTNNAKLNAKKVNNIIISKCKQIFVKIYYYYNYNYYYYYLYYTKHIFKTEKMLYCWL